jgi:hypothetical protein
MEAHVFHTVVILISGCSSGQWTAGWTAGWQYWLVEKLVAIIKFVMVLERFQFSPYEFSLGHDKTNSCHGFRLGTMFVTCLSGPWKRSLEPARS